MKNLNVMAFVPHPDDADAMCGGTLAKYAKNGAKIYIVIAANGNAGHLEMKPEEISKIRKKEAENAAAILGAEMIWLGYDDHFLMNDKPTRIKFIDTIRMCKPDVILTCPPNDWQPDHTNISQLVFDASMIANIPLVKTEHEHLEKIPYLYYFEPLHGVNFIPDEYVDITDSLNTKIKMISQHKSQVDFMFSYFNVDIIEHIKIDNRYRGLQCDVEYAEGFQGLKAFGRLSTKRILP